ncbi:MAG: FecR family protein [Carboxylicivirga sp.]|nr:FecR family protein [Carboxylicivirga sp.]
MDKKTLNKFTLNQISDASIIKEVLDWIDASEDNKKEYVRLKNLWAISDFKNYDDINSSEDSRLFLQNRGRSLATFLKYAAILILAFLAGGISFWTVNNGLINSELNLYTTIVAPKGSVAKTLLPDGTELILNSETEIRYNAQTFLNNRELSVNGEAWFHVSSDKERPFVVHTEYYDVNVLGTKFNVNAYAHEHAVVTTLAEGKVLINSFANDTKADEVILKPGEQLIYHKTDAHVHVTEVNTSAYCSWRHNELEFNKVAFGELVDLLEVRYNVNIKVVDSSLLEESFTGTLKDETIEEVMEIIRFTYPITYSIKGQNIIVRKL